jgi:hypothetical protein
MDMAEMKGAEAAPQQADGEPPVPSQPPEAAIEAAIVQATKNSMSYMRQAMNAAGHTPPGL